MAELTCRFIEIIGQKTNIIALWDGPCGCCSAREEISREMDPEAKDIPESLGDYSEEDFPSVCSKCRKPRGDAKLKRALSREPIFNTKSESPEPGDMFWFPDWLGDCFDWDNCDGKHLKVILPNGDEWDVDGRATNCTMPNDRKHRCWVREGTPPNVHVSKKGPTCGAGAGSIASGKYHGFLRHGKLVG